MRTIFISAFNPFILRNILLSDALTILKKQSDLRIVVLVPEYKVNFFKKEIGSPNTVIEGFKTQNITRQDALFRFIMSSLANTSTLRVHKKVEFLRSGRYLRYLTSMVLMNFLSYSKTFKRLMRTCDFLTLNKIKFSPLFERYYPDLVFTTDVFNDDDVYLLAESRRRRVKTISMVRSWDNFTTKGVFRIKPDSLIVHNEIIRDEAVRYGDMKSADIIISGIPNYDRYFKGGRMTRQAFFKKIGLDSKRKLILFSPFGNRFSETDWQIMSILKEIIKSKLIPPAQVLVRFTPNDKVELGDFVPNQYFYIDKPGHQFKAGVFRDQELTHADMEWLADSLYHSDVLVAGGASIGIDAAIFGKPTILIHFDGLEDKPYAQSAKRFSNYSHGTQVTLKTGALRSAGSREELKQHLLDYLVNPMLDSDNRARMVQEQCWRLDGRAGERIGQAILAELGF